MSLTASPITDRVLMGPGPCNPYPEVMAALSRPMLGHLDPEFIALLDQTNDRLRTVFDTANALTFPLSGTGSAGMEAVFVNVVEPGDVVVIGVNGVFGERMVDVAGRCGAKVVRVDAEWGSPIDVEALASAHPSPKVIAAVHAETSTGVRNDVHELQALLLAQATAGPPPLLVLDCVTSLGGLPVHLDEWGIDLAYSGTQKCLGVPPGLAPVSVSAAARERLLPTPRSWYLDLNMIARYVGGDGARAYHHTAPISMIFALHAGLGAVLAEGLVAVQERHQSCGAALQGGLEDLGLSLFAKEGNRLPQLTSVWVPLDRLPIGMDEAGVRRALLARYGIEIGGGIGEFAGKVWRIGCMGHTARPRNVMLLLAALEEMLAP